MSIYLIMDESSFHLSISHLATQGVVLSTEHSVALQASLSVLKSSQQLSQVRFWGKINGSGVADYYIAEGTPAAAAADATKNSNSSPTGPAPHMFYTQDCVNWAQLQPVHPVLSATCSRIRTRFTGNPSTEVTVVEPGPSADVARTDGSDAVPPMPSDLVAARKEETKEDGSLTITTTVTEDRRLAATIALIDTEAGIVPRGAFVQTAGGAVSSNPSYVGMTLEDALKPGSYLHWREASGLNRKTHAEKAKLDRALDFLDPISEDIPNGAWSIRTEAGGAAVVVASLAWPGALHYVLPGRPDYGQVYWGTGVKNIDLPFML